MGCVCSKHLGGKRTRHENISLLTSQTIFSDAEVEVLHELFTKLTSCVSSDNVITKEGFQFILTKDTKRRSLSTERLHFGYMILVRLDLLNRKRITQVKEMIIDVLEESELMLTESIIDSIVSKTFEEADRKKDGKIDLEEWENFVARHPLTLKNMTIPFLK
ncbi:hypothetical protein BRARA_J01575 [Brassica rapa]|nr:hypothetical protein BRARA_J01575 [Brassica rapa]